MPDNSKSVLDRSLQSGSQGGLVARGEGDLVGAWGDNQVGQISSAGDGISVDLVR